MLLSMSPAFAAPLPENAPQSLGRILSQPEFAGRKTVVGPLEKLMRHVRQELHELILRVRDWLRGVEVPSIGEPAWLGTLKRLLAPIAGALAWLIEVFMRFSATLAFAAFFGLGLFFAYRYYRQRKSAQTVACEAALTPAASTVSRAGVSVLIEMGFLTEALTELRLAVRRVLGTCYNVAKHETDRQLISRLPAADRRGDVYSRIAALFENTAFAGHSPTKDHLRALYLAARTEMGEEL